jgi:hypothetical protein
LNPEYILSGVETIYDIEVNDKNLKKTVDSIIGNSEKEFIRYYYKDTLAGNRDPSFSYEEFTQLNISELRDLGKRGGGSKGSGYWRDKDNNLRDKDGNIVSKGR